MLVIKIIEVFFQVYSLMIFIRILGSWIPEIQGNRLFLFLAFYTDPYLNLFRRIIPPLGMMDLSPIVAFLCLSVIKYILEFIVIWLIR